MSHGPNALFSAITSAVAKHLMGAMATHCQIATISACWQTILMSLELLLQSTINVANDIFAMYLNVSQMAASLNMWQVWNEDQADEEVLAMVVCTGLCTAMGDMLRQVVAPINETSPFKDPFVTVRMYKQGGKWCCWWPETMKCLVLPCVS